MGYYDCNHIYAIDPVSKLNILHRPDFMMNDFITDSIQILPLPNEGVVMESNLSLCGEGGMKMGVSSQRENIEFINNDIVSIESNSYFYGAGAAHGHNKVYHFIYGRENGMKLGWDDLFKDKSIEKYILDRVMKELVSEIYLEFVRNDDNRLVQKVHAIGFKTVLMNFKKSGYFTILNEGLKVQYNENEIASYAAGEPSLIVPKKILKKYMYPKIYDMCFSDKSRIKIIEACE